MLLNLFSIASMLFFAKNNGIMAVAIAASSAGFLMLISIYIYLLVLKKELINVKLFNFKLFIKTMYNVFPVILSSSMVSIG
jgi:hypothetical protein